MNEERFEKKLGLYLDFENLSFNIRPIKNNFKHIYGHITTTKVLYPILLLNEEHFEKKLGLYLDSDNLSFI